MEPRAPFAVCHVTLFVELDLESGGELARSLDLKKTTDQTVNKLGSIPSLR